MTGSFPEAGGGRSAPEDEGLYEALAAGYARARPPLHPRIVERVRGHLGLEGPLGLALDVGCGAGLSTRALAQIARRCVGVDPVTAMLRLGGEVAPGARFCAGRAEQLPVRSGSVDLLGAAGSLDYADLGRFFAEAERVLAPGGVLVVYDFSPGRRFPDSDALTTWFDRLMERYPPPSDSRSRALDPETLGAAATRLRLTGSERFEIGLTLDPAFYREYVMTETNVAHAVRGGIPAAEIRGWCRESLEPVFRGAAREVLFEGYIAYLAA